MWQNMEVMSRNRGYYGSLKVGVYCPVTVLYIQFSSCLQLESDTHVGSPSDIMPLRGSAKACNLDVYTHESSPAELGLLSKHEGAEVGILFVQALTINFECAV